MRKLTFLLVALVLTAVGLATTAGAGTPPTSTKMLRFFAGGAGTIYWTAEGGGSTDLDSHALKLAGTTQGVDYSGAYAITATSARVLLSDFNAAFAVKGYQGAGSPRISLPVDTDGDGTTEMWAYLSAAYAAGNARTPALNGFDQLDFQQSGATIYTSGPTILNGLSDPLNASGSISYQWGGFSFDVNDAGVRAGWKVAEDEQPFLILDEAPAVSFVDELTIGSFRWSRPGALGFIADIPLADNAAADGGTMHWDNGAGDSFDVEVHDVIIDGEIVAFSGEMQNGTGQWADDDDEIIQEHLDFETHELHGKIGGPDEAPTSTVGLDGPFSFTGTLNVS